MMNNTEIEALRFFAVLHGEIRFAHLCSAALRDEAWAVERVQHVIDLISEGTAKGGQDDLSDLRIIRSTDTRRPDGATPRGGIKV